MRKIKCSKTDLQNPLLQYYEINPL